MIILLYLRHTIKPFIDDDITIGQVKTQDLENRIEYVLKH